MSDSSEAGQPGGVTVLDRETVLIRYNEATRVLWGDETCHQVSDWVYGKGERIAPFMFSLRSGEYFKWSKKWKPRYDQHRLYYVLEGQLSIHDPETGEVARANAGEAIYWSGLRWHFGYNFGTTEALILEAVAPKERPPDMPEVEMSWEKPDLGEVVNGRYDLLGKWPAARPAEHQKAWQEGSIMTLSQRDCLHMIAGDKTPLPVSLFVSTEEMTVGTMDILPGKIGDPETHPGDEALFVTQGRLNVYLSDSDDWYELNRMDTLYLPEGTPHQYANMTDSPAAFFFAVAPRYR
jgi:quercetin dioxygenase-like cupin family protein